MTPLEALEVLFAGVYAQPREVHKEAYETLKAALSTDGWVLHTGTTRPVASYVQVRVRFANGGISSESRPACNWRWCRNNTGFDIVAYKLVPTD